MEEENEIIIAGKKMIFVKKHTTWILIPEDDYNEYAKRTDYKYIK